MSVNQEDCLLWKQLKYSVLVYRTQNITQKYVLDLQLLTPLFIQIIANKLSFWN